MSTEHRIDRLTTTLKYRQPDLTVVIENIYDPHNVSAILRTCDAAGVMNVQLVYTNTDFPDIGKKSSASAWKWVERRKFSSVKECYDKLHKEGFTIYATHLSKKAKSIYGIDLVKKVALVVGNEHEGVSSDASRLADGIIQIPMFGMVQSLNVSVATAIILFESVRQRIMAGHYIESKINKKEFQNILKQWIIKN